MQVEVEAGLAELGVELFGYVSGSAGVHQETSKVAT